MAENSKFEEMIKGSLDSISKMIKCETVMGDPIVTAQGSTIIPVSKLSLGYGTGGYDHVGKSDAATVKGASNLLGGGGVGMLITPLGFLVIDKEGKTEFLSIQASENVPQVVSIIDTAVDLIERSPEIIAKLKKLFEKEKDGENEKTKESEEKKD